MEVRYPPPPPTKKGYLSDTCPIPHENKAKMGATPLPAILFRQDSARYGGESLIGPLSSRCESLGHLSRSQIVTIAFFEFGVLESAKTKRGRREGDGKKNVMTICDTRHDNLRHFTTTCHPGWFTCCEPTRWSRPRRCAIHSKMHCLTLFDSCWANPP